MRSTPSRRTSEAPTWRFRCRTRPAQAGPRGDAEALEHVARIFWRLLEREADWLPPWRDLLRVYRRLEARGDIRGGRFVAGFPGEQFALPEAIGMLREVRPLRVLGSRCRESRCREPTRSTLPAS